MSLGTYIYTWIFGKFVGEDELKNRYYCSSYNFNDKSLKRWVIFKGEIEASNIPPHWHAWLHKSVESPPIKYKHKYSWQKDHQKNHTGTSKAYFPSSHPLSKSNNNSIKEDYEAWKP